MARIETLPAGSQPSAERHQRHSKVRAPQFHAASGHVGARAAKGAANDLDEERGKHHGLGAVQRDVRRALIVPQACDAIDSTPCHHEHRFGDDARPLRCRREAGMPRMKA